MPLEKMTERIDRLMREKGKNMTQVAQETDIEPERLKRYVVGDVSKMSQDEISILSEYFNVLPSYLMGWIDYRKVKYVFSGGHKEYTFKNVFREEATQKVLDLMIKEGMLTIEEIE